MSDDPAKVFHVHAFATEKPDPKAKTPQMECIYEVPDDDPNTEGYGLYERMSDGMLRHISDHQSREAATNRGLAVGMEEEKDA